MEEPRSRDELTRLSAAAGVPLLTPDGSVSASRYFDRRLLERMADRDATLRAPFLVDVQTHIWWREEGIRDATEWGREFLQSALRFRQAATPGAPGALADLGRVFWFEDVFLHSDTDVTVLNSFGMKGHYDGVDLFPPKEAAYVRSLAPARVRILGTVDPVEVGAAVDLLEYQCEALKIDGLKLFPPVPGAAGWRMDDEKVTYPLYEVLRKHGVKNIACHKGPFKHFDAPHCHPTDLVRAAADFPDLNFINYHAAYPFDDELAAEVKKRKVKNVYADLGLIGLVMLGKPERYAKLMANLLGSIGEDNILWGTDSPHAGAPQWQIQLFTALTIPEELQEKYGSPPLTREIKDKIFGLNAARIFGIDVAKAKSRIDGDLISGLRIHGHRPKINYEGLREIGQKFAKNNDGALHD